MPSADVNNQPEGHVDQEVEKPNENAEQAIEGPALDPQGRELNNLDLINAVIAPVPNLSPREQIHFLNEIFHYDDESSDDVECDCSDCEEERQAIERAKVSLDSDGDCDCTSCLSNCSCQSCRTENRTVTDGPPCKRIKMVLVTDRAAQTGQAAKVE